MQLFDAITYALLAGSALGHVFQFIDNRRLKSRLNESLLKDAVNELHDKFPVIVGGFDEYLDSYAAWLRRIKTGSCLTESELRELVDHAHRRQKPPNLVRIEERNGNIQEFYDKQVRMQLESSKRKESR